MSHCKGGTSAGDGKRWDEQGFIENCIYGRSDVGGVTEAFVLHGGVSGGRGSGTIVAG